MQGSAVVALMALLAVVAGSAYAIPVTTSFTAVGFADGAPTNPVSGTIVWEAASPTAPIESLTSVSLTIGGHTYALGEVGFLSPFFGTTDLIGGTATGLTGAAAGSDDFWLMFDRSNATPRHFLYMSAVVPTRDFSSMTFTSFSSTANAVPEPSTLALLGAGLAGLVVARRCRSH